MSWDPVVTMDFMATVLDVLGLHRPGKQAMWHFDGVSVLPLLKGHPVAPRGIGWMWVYAVKLCQAPLTAAPMRPSTHLFRQRLERLHRLDRCAQPRGKGAGRGGVCAVLRMGRVFIS